MFRHLGAHALSPLEMEQTSFGIDGGPPAFCFCFDVGRRCTGKLELHEVPGHLCNSGAPGVARGYPREPPGNSTPETHEPAK